mgnify:FL=1
MVVWLDRHLLPLSLGKLPVQLTYNLEYNKWHHLNRLYFWDELFYYESFGLFAVLILVQLAATGAAAFRIYNKQKKD